MRGMPGIGITYAPDVVVQHPARRTVGELLAKRRRILGGTVRIRRPSGLIGHMAWLGRGILPPVFAYRQIRKRQELTLEEKAGALLLCYVIKLYNTLHRALLLLKLRRPDRS
ncbi:MAG: hypothetical protein U5P41_08950 [Gammaproteobacteria bacterium]|nr:hypothetical protein [Gammaproteobacteria bacterium]